MINGYTADMHFELVQVLRNLVEEVQLLRLSVDKLAEPTVYNVEVR